MSVVCRAGCRERFRGARARTDNQDQGLRERFAGAAMACTKRDGMSKRKRVQREVNITNVNKCSDLQRNA